MYSFLQVKNNYMIIWVDSLQLIPGGPDNMILSSFSSKMIWDTLICWSIEKQSHINDDNNC